MDDLQIKNERQQYYGDDGYLSPVCGQNVSFSEDLAIGDQITRNGVKKGKCE